MIKSGLICGALMFVLAFGSAVTISPLCAVCVPLLAGLLAGYLTGVFEKPTPDVIYKRSAGAGAIAGGLGLFGSMAAGLVNAFFMQNPENQGVNKLLGVPANEPGTVWGVQLGLSCCVALFNIGLCAGLAVAGGAIWNGTAGKQLPPPPPDVPAY